MENLNAEKIVIEIQSLIKALKANKGWWENRGRGGWFNHDILVDALALITSQEQRIKELEQECEKWRSDWEKNQKRWEISYDELDKEKHDLELTLVGVMFSVDKWLDGAELEQDEVNRAITMREKTLQIVEKLTEQWEEATNRANYIADVTRADTVRKMLQRIKEDAIAVSLLSNPPKFMLEIREDALDQIAKEMLEGENEN